MSFDQITADLQVNYFRSTVANFLASRNACPEEIAKSLAEKLTVTHNSYDTSLVTPLELDLIALATSRQLTNMAENIAVLAAFDQNSPIFNEDETLNQEKLVEAVIEKFVTIDLNHVTFTALADVMARDDVQQTIAELKEERGDVYALFDVLK